MPTTAADNSKNTISETRYVTETFLPLDWDVLGEIRKITLMKKNLIVVIFLVVIIKYRDVKMNIRREPV